MLELAVALILALKSANAIIDLAGGVWVWTNCLHLALAPGSLCVPVAAAAASKACADSVHLWFDSLQQSQPLIINAGMDAPSGPRSACSRPAAESEAPAALERWLDQQRFSYVELATDVATIGRASSAALILSLLWTLLEVALLAFTLFAIASDTNRAPLLWTSPVYTATAMITLLILRAAASVHSATLKRCTALDVGLHQVPLSAAQQVQTLVLRRPVAYTLGGYPLTFADLARVATALATAAVPAIVRASVQWAQR